MFMIFIGLIMIIALCRIYRVKNILPENEKADFKSMLQHSIAFGLFLVSAIILCFTNYLYLFFPDSIFVYNLFNASVLVYAFLQFVSECFILVVLWNLGQNHVSEESIVSLMGASWDEDAEI
jgi:hypothetical protein